MYWGGVSVRVSVWPAAEGVLEKKTRVPTHRLRAPATVATPAPAHLSAFEFRVEERRAWYI
jgi:hypothetical protein